MAPPGYPPPYMAPAPQTYQAPYPQQYAPAPLLPPSGPAGPMSQIGTLMGVGFLLAAVGFMIFGSLDLWMANADDVDYEMIYNLNGIAWILAGVGLILMAVAQFSKATKKV